MLDSLKKPPGALRWAPRQKFMLTEAGKESLRGYQDVVALHQASGNRGRDGLEKLQASWSESFKVLASDAMILEEFGQTERQPREIQNALADCGTTMKEVQAAIDRLYLAGLLGPVGGGGPIPPTVRSTEYDDE